MKNVLLVICLFLSNISFSQNLWKYQGIPPGGTRIGAITFSIGNNAYYGTGYSSLNVLLKDMWKFDGVSKTWTQLNDFPTLLNTATAFVINDTAYVVTGRRTAGGSPNPDVYRYDVLTDSFSIVGTYPGPLGYTNMSFVIDQKAYVGVGYSPLNNQVWEYAPHTNTWTQKANFPGNLRQNTVGESILGLGYVGCGAYDPIIAYSDFYSYNPLNDTWTQIPSIPGGGRFAGIKFVLNGKLYVGCGYDYSNYLKDVWSYDPLSNSWTAESDFGGIERYSAFSFTIGNTVYCGNGRGSVYYSDMWEFTPTSPNLIIGRAFRDDNANSAFDSLELPVKNLLVEVNPGGNIYSTNRLGHFTTLADSGIYTISLPNPPLYYSYSPINPVVFTTTGVSDSTTVIPFTPTSTINDLEIYMTLLTLPQPGFTTAFNVTCKNVGTTMSTNTKITVILDSLTSYDKIVPFDSINHTISGDTISLVIGDLNPGEEKSYMIYTIVDTSATLFDTVRISGMVEPILIDITPNNNTYNLISEVVGSFDPNDIQVQPTGSITPMQVSNQEWLNYTIRFQNTGTAAANKVVVINPIDFNLNLATLEIVSASHNYELFLAGDRDLKFLFANINLADSNHNEPESHGFIKYRIKPMQSLVVGDKIENQCDIYFDYNTPVITNKVTTPILHPTGIQEYTNQVKVYPNPSNGLLNISSSQKVIEASVSDISGKLVLAPRNVTNNSISIANLENGFYFLTIRYENNQKSIVKILLSK